MSYGYSPIEHRHDHTLADNRWTPSMVVLNQKLRSLWEQHVYWTRLAVTSIMGRLPDENAAMARLLRNADDFADAMRPYYGSMIAAGFGTLLRGHLAIGAEWVKAMQAGDTEAASNVRKRWFAHAEEIAVFLGRTNPFWSQLEWRNMLHGHLGLLSEEAVARLAGDYEENVAIHDRVEPLALKMADVMTSGIVQQFPRAFAS